MGYSLNILLKLGCLLHVTNTDMISVEVSFQKRNIFLGAVGMAQSILEARPCVDPQCACPVPHRNFPNGKMCAFSALCARDT